MRNRGLTAAVAVCLVLGPSGAWAQDRGALRTQAKNLAAQVRAAGEPKDRCSLNAWFADGGLVVRTIPGSSLAPGDQLISLESQNVGGKSADEIATVLRNFGPVAAIPARIKRSGAEMPIDLKCSNGRSGVEVLVRALDFAAAGKFDECVAALGERDDLNSGAALLKAQCAAASRKSANYNQAQLMFDAMRLQLEDARWHAPARAELVKGLRATEGVITQGLGSSKYEELVAITLTWPGGETLYADSAPDWSLFRRNSEAALRARLIDPESARIEWPHGFTYGSWRPLLSKQIDGYWTCGTINARNRMGGYTGSTSFVVVLDPSAAVKYVEMGEARDFDLLGAQCLKSIKFLPPPQVTMTATSSSAPPAVSLADELKKLSDLKNAGALTDSEFEAAKRRLLSQ